MNRVLLLLLLLSSSQLFAQLELRPVKRPVTKSSDYSKSSRQQVTLTVPVFDDFSRSNLIDSNVWQYGNTVFISPNGAENLPSINVAIFDGLDENGNAYDIDENLTVPTDSLVSHPFDLTQIPESRQDSLHLNFFWQARALGEMPTERDSLTLWFLNKDSVWVSQDISPEDIDNNGILGGESALRYESSDSIALKFENVNVKVDTAFIHSNFRIKFQSYGSAQGPLDTWAVDYILLATGNLGRRREFLDLTISKGASSPFGLLNAIPANHLKELGTFITEPMNFEYYRLFRPFRSNGIVDYFVNILDEDKQLIEALDTKRVIQGSQTDGEIVRLPFSSSTFDAVEVFDLDTSFNFYVEAYYLDTLIDDSGIPDDSYYSFRANDTVRTKFEVADYYAYDDGTADYAAGISREKGQLVVQYPVYVEDTLTGVDIYFPDIFTSDKPENRFSVIVLRDLLGTTSSELARLDAGKPDSVTSINQFRRYVLKTQPIVSDTIYIGIQQEDNNFFPIGWDKNNLTENRIYFYVDEEEGWQQNLNVHGSLMIRPVFDKADSNAFITGTANEIQNIKAYPNPATTNIRVSGQFDNLKVLDMRGRPLDLKVDGDIVNVATLPRGIYLLLVSAGDQRKVIRFLKE